MKAKNNNNINIKNKRASFDYEIIDTLHAGIVLTGTEIKSIREYYLKIVPSSWKVWLYKKINNLKFCFHYARNRLKMANELTVSHGPVN